MKRASYRDRNYAFGQAILTLRNAMGLTQAGLAELLGVSRYALGDWEAGEKYPKAEHLKHFITLAVQQQAFPAGHEEDEIRALWKLSHQKVLLDEHWLASLLAPTPIEAVAASATPLRQTNDRQQRHGERDPVFSLPTQSTSFVGRVDELTEIARILADPACRLLTLLGTGGIGKTRLASEVAAGQIDAFADGVVFIPLASVGTASQIVSAIGDALAPSFLGRVDSAEALLGYLRERQMLIVLDNFEHLLEGANLVHDILQSAPQVKLLITSRERLNLRLEWLFDVVGLAYPSIDVPRLGESQSATFLTQYSAVQLFVQRATQIQPQFALSEANLTTIARIGHFVAGMPLAIELAAAGTRWLPISEIEQQIRSNLDVLATTLRDVPARHRSLRAVFDQSWNLLDEPERALFSHLAVFRGGCTLEAAVQVAGATLPRLVTLIDKSLLRHLSAEAEPITENAAPGRMLETRFGLLEPLREYALEKLALRGEGEALRRAHALYYLGLAEALAARWQTAQGDEEVRQLSQEVDNMRAALQWACDGDSRIGLLLALALWRFWRSFGYISEGRVWLERLLGLNENDSDPSLMAAQRNALNAAAWLASDQHDYTQATRLFEQSLMLRDTPDEFVDELDLLINAAREARAAGQYQRATSLLEDVLARCRVLDQHTSLGNTEQLTQVLRELGLACREQGQFERATVLFEEGLKLDRARGDRTIVSLALLGVADVARDQGDSARVREYAEESLVILRELGMQWAIGFTLNTLAQAALVDNDLPQAFALISESASLFRNLKNDGGLAEVLVTLGRVLSAQGDMAAAREALTEALLLASKVGPRFLIAAALEGLADVLAHSGDAALSVRCGSGAAALRADMGAPMRPVDLPAFERALATAKANLGDNIYADVWANAQEQPLEQILSAIPGVSSGTLRRRI
jgi:predicted ATPase/transcriptional regulator with XRE-family HTH domain